MKINSGGVALLRKSPRHAKVRPRHAYHPRCGSPRHHPLDQSIRRGLRDGALGQETITSCHVLIFMSSSHVTCRVLLGVIISPQVMICTLPVVSVCGFLNASHVGRAHFSCHGSCILTPYSVVSHVMTWLRVFSSCPVQPPHRYWFQVTWSLRISLPVHYVVSGVSSHLLITSLHPSKITVDFQTKQSPRHGGCCAAKADTPPTKFVTHNWGNLGRVLYREAGCT